MKPLAVDLACGLGGWTEGLLAEGWNVVGFDIERHTYGDAKYPAQLVLQDILTIDGRLFRGKVSLIVASPPCTEYSYMAMPWRRAKQIAQALRGVGEFPEGYAGSRTISDLNRLFNACFRIAREAECPIVVENVRGATPWVGRARATFGSFYLWGDVPALMPMTKPRAKVGGISFSGYGTPGYKGAAFNGTAEQRLRDEGVKAGDRNKGRANSNGHKWDTGFDATLAHNTTSGKGQNPVEHFKLKDQDGYERNHPQAFGWKKPRTSSKSSARQAASAHIAKIPEVLARHIARAWWPA